MLTHHIILIITLSGILAASPFAAKLLRLPITVVEILFGTLFAYIGFIEHNTFFEIIAEVGFLYLMFLAGLEINIKELLRMDPRTLRKGLIYIALLYAVAAVVRVVLGVSDFFILIYALISIGVVITLTKDYDKETPWLRLSLQIGILGELASILGLTVASGLLHFGVSREFVLTMFYLVAALVGIGLVFYVSRVIFWWFPNFKMLLMPHMDNNEQDIRLSFSVFFILVSFMLGLGLELALGAFMAGLFISSYFEHKKELPHKLSSFGFGFLVPLFFIHIGSTLDVDAVLNTAILLKALSIMGIMVFIRLVASLVFVKEIGLKSTVLFALSQSMPLTLMIVVATLAYNMKSIDTFHYYAFILAALIQVLVVLILIRVVDRFFPEMKEKLRSDERERF